MYTRVTSLDTAVKYAYLRTDSAQYTAACGGGWYIYANMLKPYVPGDTITTGTYISAGDLATSGHNVNCYSYNDGLWVKSYDQYIGVRYNGGAMVQYGWIRVLVSSISTAVVKDFSLGNYVAGMANPEQPHVNFYPNPASEAIYIEGADVGEVKLLNNTGNLVLKTDKKCINVQGMSNGLYILQAKTHRGFLTRKLIIHH